MLSKRREREFEDTEIEMRKRREIEMRERREIELRESVELEMRTRESKKNVEKRLKPVLSTQHDKNERKKAEFAYI